MGLELRTPDADQLAGVVAALRDWQRDDAPLQLHPGDLGWFGRFGAEATAAAMRTWSRDGQVVALGLLDGPDLLRMTVAPEAWRDEDMARQLVADLSDPDRGVLPAGEVSVETPEGIRVQELLSEAGWNDGEPWTPLRRDLTEPVERIDVRTEVIGPERAAEHAAIVRSAFGSTSFTTERWTAMAGGAAYGDARSLLAYDDEGVAVAAVTVWSAGEGRPGLVEPMGVQAEHRGRGYGRAICLAAAAELQGLGASSVLVCTPSALTGAVATYASAGFERLPQRLDRTRAG